MQSSRLTQWIELYQRSFIAIIVELSLEKFICALRKQWVQCSEWDKPHTKGRESQWIPCLREKLTIQRVKPLGWFRFSLKQGIHSSVLFPIMLLTCTSYLRCILHFLQKHNTCTLLLLCWQTLILFPTYFWKISHKCLTNTI